MTNSKRVLRTCVFVIVSLLLTVCLAIVGVGFVNTTTASADEDWAMPDEDWAMPVLKTTYYRDDEIKIPNGILSIERQDYDAIPVLYYPDGRAYSKQIYNLDQTGLYTVEFCANVDGSIKKETVTFKVVEPLYDVSGDGTASYGKYSETAKKDGVIVSLPKNSELLLSKTIDLNNSTFKDPIVEGFVLPDKNGKRDFWRLYIKLTDMKNADKYILVSMRSSEEDLTHAYVQAAGNGQTLSGVEMFGSEERLHISGVYGAPILCSFSGSNGRIEEDLFSLRYDAETKTIYMGDTFVADLDDPTIFGSLWDGFESGLVKMSIYADEYVSENAKIVLTAVKDCDLRKNVNNDTIAPVVNVDMLGYTEAPYAKVGTAYKLFSATAYDSQDGDVPVEARVQYNLGSSTFEATDVSVVDGSFVPQKAGEYTIQYYATDKSGNTSAPVDIRVHAKDDIGNVTVTAQQPSLVGTTGVPVEVGDIVVKGGSSVRETKIYALDGNGERYEIHNLSFIPLKSDTYSIVYEATDYIGQSGTFTYEVQVTDSDKPIISNPPILPKAIISGTDFKVPDLTVKKYQDNSVSEILCEVAVKIDGGEEVEVDANGKIKIETQKSSGGMVEFIYRAAGMEQSYFVPIISAYMDESLNLPAYFETFGGIAMSLSTEAIEFKTSTLVDDENGFTFLNALLAEGLEVGLMALPQYAKFGSVDLYLIDAQNESNSVKVTLANKSGTVYLSVNGGEGYALKEASFTDSKKSKFSLNYENGKIKVAECSIALTTYIDGRPFEGFLSQYLYVKGVFNDVSGDAGIGITALNSQNFNSEIKNDSIRPKIVLIGEYGGTVEIGTRYRLPDAYAADVLSGNVNFTLSVYAPGEKFATSTDGTLLNEQAPGNYEIELSDYGIYTFEYVAFDDKNGRKATLSFTVTVEYNSLPEIIVSQDIATAASVGDTIVVPNATAECQLYESSEVTVLRYVVTPQGIIREISSSEDNYSNSFKVEMKGTYVIRYMAIDPSGNISILDFAIEVK